MLLPSANNDVAAATTSQLHGIFCDDLSIPKCALLHLVSKSFAMRHAVIFVRRADHRLHAAAQDSWSEILAVVAEPDKRLLATQDA